MEDREKGKMHYIQEIEEHNNLKTFVLGDLKKIGIKPPKFKRSKSKDDNIDEGNQSVFGNHLCNVPSLMKDGCGPVPRFLVEGSELLERHIDTEGLFRKSGSVARQKELKDKINLGEPLQNAHPYDVASLIKQFFRELPDALLTSRFHDTFLKCQNIESDFDRVSGVLLLCLLLPWHHLSTLKYFAQFLAKVARNSDQNKMDANNLAVCLAPNLLHINCKAEKMRDYESKLLQAQTNTVQLLIEHADDIGMLTDTLHEKASLMGSLCFPSDDELEKSCDELDDSRPTKNKKKKKRSGSLQGLVNNLSSSFSKWRRDSKGHNSSSVSDKSSMLSIVSTDTIDASCSSENSPDIHDMQASLMNDFQTPKVMRKRKASNEMMPFSASKKKAILQQMPQMSTLGTPYTPAARSRLASGHDFALGTPNIKFAGGSSQMVFTATPSEAPTPVGPTPRRKMDRILSPSSAMKVKRHQPGKAGCFSPKTPKSGKRRSVRGFFRRLSGGKEQSPGGGHDSSDIIGSRLANGTGPVIMRPGSGGKKKGGFFKRHKKTPSSPARLVTNIIPNRNAADMSYDIANCTAPDHSASMTSTESYSSLEVAAQLSNDLQVPKMHRRGYSADGTPINTSALRRGRPNTVAVGLPEPNKRRSFDQGSLGSSPVHAPSHPPRHSSQREIFTSPKRHEHLECSPVAFDTSPIPKADFQMLDCSPIGGADHTMEIPCQINIEDTQMMETSGCVSRHGSSSSLCLEGQNNATMADANMTQLESDHEKAFIIEESMCAENLDETSVKSSATEDKPSTQPGEVFKKPLTLPVAKKKEAAPTDVEADTTNLMDASVSSDASDTSVITVIYNGQPVSSKLPLQLKQSEISAPPSNDSRKQTSCGLKSRDSGVDLSAAGSSRQQGQSKMCKSASVQSMTSLDSGLGMETVEQEDSANHGVKDDGARVASSDPRHQEQAQLSRASVGRNSSFRALKEGAEPVAIQKRSMSVDKHHSGPQLRVSAEMHQMLSRVGVVDDKSKRGKRAPFIALPMVEKVEGVPAELHSASSTHESVKNLLEKSAGRVAAAAKQFSKAETEAEGSDVIERHTSPLRFPNSTSRRGGASPVRIPSVFAKADEEAAMYREVARNVMRGSPKSGVRARPNLPITTSLVRSSSVESARKRLSTSNLKSPEQTNQQTLEDSSTAQSADNTAGHTPVRPTGTPMLHSVEINDSLLDTINEVCTPKCEKLKGNRSPLKDNTNTEVSEPPAPRLKPPMLVTDVGSRLLAKSLHTAVANANTDTPVRKCRAPMKSVKRLQGSPHSPRSPAKSPKRYQNASKPGQLSPLPQHLLDWNV